MQLINLKIWIIKGECLSSFSGENCEVLECDNEPEFCPIYFKPLNCDDILGLPSMCPKVILKIFF